MSDPLAISAGLCAAVEALRFAPPVAYVYNPLAYARPSCEAYLRRYARRGAELLFLGMNPGPFGMAQTGVPFGEVGIVREWLGIEAPVGKPPREHPARPIRGFACERSEVSGSRLWGWARARLGTPERFFERAFVWNYCPLVFLEEGGRNRTPDKLPTAERERLFGPCDQALRELVAWMEPRLVVGVGRFAEQRAREALGGQGPRVATVLHPSPASPAANRGWAAQVEAQLEELGVSPGTLRFLHTERRKKA